MPRRRAATPAEPAPPQVPMIPEAVYYAGIQAATRAQELEVKKVEIELTGLAHLTQTMGTTQNATIAAQAHTIQTLTTDKLSLLGEIQQRDKRIAELEKQSEEYKERADIRAKEADKARLEAEEKRRTVIEILTLVAPVVQGGAQLGLMLLASKMGITMPPSAAGGALPAAPAAAGPSPAANTQAPPSTAAIEHWLPAFFDLLSACSKETIAEIRALLVAGFHSQPVAQTLQPLLARIASEAGEQRMQTFLTFTLAADPSTAAGPSQQPQTPAASAA